MAKTLDEAGVKRLIQEIKGANKDLNTPIPISTDNTTESMAQNVKNIADYIEKAKAAGIANVNGMAVTCLIDNDYSGVGYLYSLEEKYIVQGVLIKDDLVDNMCFSINTGGHYIERGIIVADNNTPRVTSDMLVKGARKPIILTPDTTEVDEETYQKLLSDNVDVVFKTEDDNLCILTYMYESGGTTWDLIFTCLSLEDSDLANLYLYGYSVSIKKSSPHSCVVNQIHDDDNSSLAEFLGLSNFIKQSTLTSVLQEINLTGTDAERKAKLDKFETDWKELTGSDNLAGARFVGFIDVESGLEVIFSYNASNGYWSGLNKFADGVTSVTINPLDGSFTITPLFSYLEAITIYTDNTAEHMQANLDNIAAYETNLQVLGVDTTHDVIPIVNENGVGGSLIKIADRFWAGCIVSVDPTTLVKTVQGLSITGDGNASIDSFVNKSLNAKSLEVITIKTGNTPGEKAVNVAAINAYVDNLKALGVDTTKGYMIPFRKYNTNAYGVLIGTGTTPRLQGYLNGDNTAYAYVVDIDGTVAEALIQLRTDAHVETKSKYIVGAINEVNTLAKAVKAFGAIELKASDNDSNKAAITAYLKILTDAGVSTTNGYSVPVRITGNSQEYHGMLNIGTGVLLSGVVTDVNENHHYPFNVSTTDGAILFDETNYFLEKASNEVTEMLDAIKYSYTSVPFTDTTLSNKAQLEVFLSKVPAATVMHCTYMEIWAGTLHKINGDWYGLLVKNTNDPADNINVKLSADGTIIKSNSAQ